MHLKPERRFFAAAFLVGAAATLVASFPHQQAAPKPRERRGHSPNRGASTRLQAPRAAASSSGFPHSNMDGKRTEIDERTPGKVRQSTGERVHVVSSIPAEDCVGGQVELATLGRFYISGRLELNIRKGEYQADSADSGWWIAGISIFS